MDRWDAVLLTMVGYVAVMALVRLMLGKRERTLAEFRRRVEAEKRRRSEQERREEVTRRREAA